MKFHVLTLFPEMITQGLSESIIGRAQKNGLLSVNAVNIRDYTLDKHGKVDDYPYGGGAGLLMQAQPVFDAYKAVVGEKKVRTVFLTPKGKTFNQRMAEEFAKEEELVFLCGHYEGIDERVLEEIVTDPVSIGDFVLTGGELPAMMMIDAIARLIPGVLHNDFSAVDESFSGYLLEYPQYTRPEVWHDKKVPTELLSGNHKVITKWRKEKAEEVTYAMRPDMYEKYEELLFIKEKLIQKNKLLCKDMTELIVRGEAKLLYQDDDVVLLAHTRSPFLYLYCENESFDRNIFSSYSDEGQTIVLHNMDGFMADECREYALFCYTKKEMDKTIKGDVRVLDLAYMEEMARIFCANGLSYCQKDWEWLLLNGRVLGAFENEELIGFMALLRDGAMDVPRKKPQVESNCFEVLEMEWINRQILLGYTPYIRVETKDERMIALQEKLGLYRAKGNQCLVQIKK